MVITREDAKDQIMEEIRRGKTVDEAVIALTNGPYCERHQVYHGREASKVLYCWRERRQKECE